MQSQQCSSLLKSVADAVVSVQPRPQNADATIDEVLHKLADEILQSSISNIKALIIKNIQKTSPVYAHVVSHMREESVRSPLLCSGSSRAHP